MQRIKHILAVVILLVLLGGCSGLAPKSQEELWGCSLKITLSSWSGWEEGYDPQEVIYEFKIDSLGEITVPPEGGFGFNITEINANGITFDTEEPLSPLGSTINLGTEQTVFTVYQGHMLSLVTPTMDYGTVYIIEPVDLFRVN